MSPSLPTARGPLTAALFAHWATGRPLAIRVPDGADPLTDDDFHLALWCCYQLHHTGFDGVEDDLEWELATLAFRDELERRFEAALRSEHQSSRMPEDPVTALRVIAQWAGPPLSSMVEDRGTAQHLREFAIHRSAYQLKEADGHTWAIPRLQGPGRAAMIEIQADEYGNGAAGQAHSDLFAAAMEQLGLDPSVGHYLDELPGATLATDNLVSMFGLHRRLRGALVGHLSLFEMCSVVPMSRYLSAARRIGGLPALERFYEVHVEVDAHHAELALDTMVTGVVASEPHVAADVIFGAAALSRTEARFARHLLRSWDDGRSSLFLSEPGSDDRAGATPRRSTESSNASAA